MKLRIDGHEVEAEAEVLKLLLFGSKGYTPRAEIATPASVLKPSEEPLRAVKVCRICNQAIGSRQRFLCKSADCIKKYYDYWRRKRLRKTRRSYPEHIVMPEKRSDCVVCGNPVPEGNFITCGNFYCKKVQHNNKAKSYKSYHTKKDRKVVVKKGKRIDSDYLSKRMKFICRRGKEIAISEKINYAFAKAKASQEWEANKVRFHNRNVGVVPSVFPKISGLSKLGLETFEGILKHTIANKASLTYFAVKNSVDRVDDGWDGFKWHELVREVVSRSNELTNYFGVKGKFKLMLSLADFEYLKYED